MKKETENYEAFESTKTIKKRDVFITEDGKKFYNEKEASKHEKKLAIPAKYYYSGTEVSGTFYHLTSIKDIHTLEFDYYLKRGQIKESQFTFPGWYLFNEEEAPNGWFLSVQSLKSVKESLEEALRELPTEEEVKK